MKSRFEQFSFMIAGIHRYIQKIEREEMEKRGYKGAFAQYLAALNRFEEGLTPTELCEICEKDKAAVSRIIAEMEEKGLVEKEKDGKKIYRAKITLTEKGKETADFVTKRARAAVTAVSGEIMTEEERTSLYALLDYIFKNLQKVSKEGIPLQ